MFSSQTIILISGSELCINSVAITRIPKSPGWEPVPVLVRKWAAQQKVNSWWGAASQTLSATPPLLTLMPGTTHSLPHSWKNCLLGNQFLMQKGWGLLGSMA